MLNGTQFFLGAVPGFVAGIAVGAVAMLFIIKLALAESRQKAEAARAAAVPTNVISFSEARERSDWAV